MGTPIELKVGGVGLDYAMNGIGIDHGWIFQETNRQQYLVDVADDDYAEDDTEMDLSLYREAFVRPLSQILPRLNLAGWTIRAAQAEYELLLNDQQDLDEGAGPTPLTMLSFDEFCALVERYPLSELDPTADFDKNESFFAARFRATQQAMDRLPRPGDAVYWSEQSYFASRVCLLHPYSMLQVFGRAEVNRNSKVVWQYGPLVADGKALIDEFVPGATRPQTVLIATEGTSDSHILKHAFQALRQDISDFFRFVDLDERHPFWGTGNLVKFAEGLMRIDIQNKVLFVLDNDAEGVDALARLNRLRMPSNMRAMLLPDEEFFSSFPAIGPEGMGCADINGRAAAIECYLDLRLGDYGPPSVRWSNYKKDVDAWQGALEHKETYMRHFLDQTVESLNSGDYETARVVDVLNSIVRQAALLQVS